MWEMDYDKAASYWEEKDAMSAKMEPVTLQKKIEAFITGNKTCALATAFKDFVRCTPIEYNYVDNAFYLFSEGGLKFKNLKENDKVSLAIFASYEGFGNLKGLQVQGIATMIEPFSEEYVKLLEFRRIPMDAMKKLPQPMNLIKVTPVSYDYLDSDLKKEGFGIRQHLQK